VAGPIEPYGRPRLSHGRERPVARRARRRGITPPEHEREPGPDMPRGAAATLATTPTERQRSTGAAGDHDRSGWRRSRGARRF